MGLGALSGLTPWIGKALRFAQPAVRHVGKNLWKYGGALEGGKSLLRGEGPIGIAQDAISGASTGALLQAGIPGGRHMLRGGLLKAGLRPDQALLASSVAVPAVAAGGTMLLGGQGGPANQAMGGARGGTGNLLGAGATQLTREGNLVPMSALPEGYQPNANNMVRGPQGNWWYYYNPGGVPAGNRLNRQLDAITSASNINTLGNAMFGQTERKERANFERQAAAEQLAANIEQAKKMALTSQEGGIRMGMDANKAVAEAMSNRGNFNYF